MLLFAHTGIALGAATIISAAANSRHEHMSWFASLSKYADIRFLIIGSMLPDIIDKPIGLLFFNNGRIFSHTLLFFAVVTVIGIIAYATRRQVWGFSLAFGTLMHLLLDSMWGVPKTLFWPFMGWDFGKIEVSGYARMLFDALVSNPAIYTSEAIGLVVLVWFGLTVLKKKQVWPFIKTGRVS